MKLIIIGGGGFLLALGVSTYLGMQRPAAEPDGVVPLASADSTHVPVPEHAREDTTEGIQAAVPSETHPPDSAAVAPVPAEQSPPAPVVPTDTAVPDPPEKQVGRILAQMKPADAAGILGFLGDEEVARIFCHLGVRQAAALMEQIPAERAATLTRSALHRGTPGCER